MHRPRLSLPSPAMVVAVVALVVALGGTVYATGRIDGHLVKKNSLPGNRIAKKSEPGNKLRDNTVTGTQVNEATLGEVSAASFARHAARADTAGVAELAQTAQITVPPAYAHIEAGGAVDPTDSHNLTDANVTHPHKGIYCLSGLDFKPHLALAEVDTYDGPGLTETSVLRRFFFCPDEAEVEIATYDVAEEQIRDFSSGFYLLIF
ncbi:MAG TPA: hypothetical protein VFP17_01885 [Solirubrobacterales bacterium]|nr:hypothetical protein [Solirubrobacterales bacterium]